MRLLLTGVSAAALTALSSGAIAQQAGAGANGAQAGAVERGADEITCLDISMMDTALVPGVLYFVSGYREGAAREGAADAMPELENATTALEDPQGELPGMEDATVAQERRMADDEPGPAVAGTEADPAMEEAEIVEGDPEAFAEDVEVWPLENDEADPEAAEDAREADHEEPAAAAPAEAQVVAVRGHFEIPIERTVLACAEDPDALLADVIEAQR